MSKIKVFIVDDSAFMRKVISDMVQFDQELEVIGTARNGKDALQKLSTLQPDVITLDVEMPEMDGLETLQRIQELYKKPVIMLSSTTTAGAENTLSALELGAFDFIAKTSGSISLDLHLVQDELIKKIKLAHQYSQSQAQLSKTKPIKIEGKSRQQRLNSPTRSIGQLNKAVLHSVRNKQQECPALILIGTSTGGPKALQLLLTSLPQQKQAAILIVQHMPAGFTKSLANRLEKQTEHLVKEAEHGEPLKMGHVYIAPGGYHMGVHQSGTSQQLSILLNQEPPMGGHRPSVNALFASAAHLKQVELMTVVMTGMGKDGQEGLIKLRASQEVYSIAEDESTCIVYGMPRAIVEAQLAHEVLPLNEIHKAIERWLNR